MISIEKEHPEYAEACHLLRPGQSAYSRRAEIPFDLHRYQDGWYVYWKNPPDGQIGRHLANHIQLTSFLAGDWRIGTVLGLPLKDAIFWKRAPSRRKQC
ncbi:MAG TPA: hypothetical protein VGC39_00885 [Candidatus Methylacidiphilales bacterium]